MSFIYILDNQQQRRERLHSYLSRAGYEVTGSGEIEYYDSLDFSNFDLVIVNLHPDEALTWEVYMRVKKKNPGLPVLVYLEKSFHAFRSLKEVIDSILNESGSASSKNGCRRCSFSPTAAT